jgi:hypothetical protein
MPSGPAELTLRSIGPLACGTADADGFDEFFGCLKGHKLWDRDGAEITRELRDERQRGF